MIEFLTANWLWILLGIGVVWFMFGRGGMGCGMGGHSHGSDTGEKSSRAGETTGSGATHDDGADESAAPRHRHGCC